MSEKYTLSISKSYCKPDSAQTLTKFVEIFTLQTSLLPNFFYFYLLNFSFNQLQIQYLPHV